MSDPFRTAGDVALVALQRAGWPVRPETAEAVAVAVLEHADSEYKAAHAVSREMWSHSAVDLREHLEKRLRYQALREIADRGAVPVTWPNVAYRFVAQWGVAQWGVVPEADDSGLAYYDLGETHPEWNTVIAELRVPVRWVRIHV